MEMTTAIGQSKSVLQAQNLTKCFGDFVALDSLDLEVKAGELVCLLGANGAGKTTTINSFLGFLEPTRGAVFIDGMNVAEHPQKTKKTLAYIPEQVALYPQLSGLENIEYFLRLSDIKRSTAELKEMLRLAGLPEEATENRVSSYSKGMRQKVGVAIALAKEAKALLLDEPLSGLDPSAANELCITLRGLKSDGCAILMATHDVFRAKEIGTKIGIMKSGKLLDLLRVETLETGELERLYLNHMRSAESAPQTEPRRQNEGEA